MKGTQPLQATSFVSGIEALFNDALASVRRRMASDSDISAGLPETGSSPPPLRRVPNAFGGFNLVSDHAVVAVEIPQKLNLGSPQLNGFGQKVSDFNPDSDD